MKERLSQLFRLRPGEAGIVLILGFLLLNNSVALEVADVVAVSGFLSQVDVYNILLVWGIDMALLILATGLQSLIIDRFDRIKLLRGMIFAFALIYVFLRLLFTFQIPGWFNYTLLYLLSDQQWLFFPLVFWILANDVFDMAQAKRLFPLIAVFGFVGQIAGLGLSAAAPSLLRTRGIDPIELLSLNTLVYLVAYLVVIIGLRKIKLRQTTHKSETMGETLTEGWGFIREVPSFRYLTVTMMMIGLALTVIDYHFLVITDMEFPSQDSFQTFYGLYRLGVTGAAILIQSLVTSRIIDKINLKNTFLILPLALTASLSWMVALPGLVSSAGGRALSRLTFTTIDESARKAFQALVPEERRGRVSIFMESYLPSLGTILGALITGLIIFVGIRMQSEHYFYVYLGIALAASIVAIWAIIKMRAVYDSSLFNWRLKRRQRGSDVLDKLDF